MIPEQVRKTVLENGVRVVTETIPHADAISMSVLFEAGPRDEGAERCGLAHLSEHLMFQGTGGRSALEIARFMDSAGGYMGGFTSRDYTAYTATVLPEFATYALDLFGDVALNSVFPEECVEREKEAIVCEIEASLDAPNQRVEELMRSCAWRGHSLGRPIAGDPTRVRSFTREDIIYFVSEHYMPNRAFVVAAGDVDHDDFVAQVRDSFWRLLGEKEPAREAEPVFQPGLVIAHAPVSQAYFSLGLRAPAYADADRYGMHVLSKVLGDGISSRLFRRVREERGLVYDIASEYYAYADAGMLVVEGSTIPEKLSEVVEVTIDELRKLLRWHEPVDDEELLRAKTQTRGQHLISGQDVNTRMQRLATQEIYFGRPVPSEEVLHAIASVDGAALRGLGETLRGGDEVVLAVVGPEVADVCDGAALERILTK
jgi:predicted Zn-dependent peptidase